MMAAGNPNLIEANRNPLATVLVADDDQAIRLVLRHRLEAAGFAVEEASDSQSALDALRTAAEGSANVLPPMREALALRATGGEVAYALRDVWGQYVPSETL